MSEYRGSFTFRLLTMDDIPQMSIWLSDPDVAEWYGEGGTSIEHLTDQYSPKIQRLTPTLGYIAKVDGVDIGYIQAVPIDGYPDYSVQLQIEPGAVGVDIFIGEAVYRGRGLGTTMLRAFTDEIVFGQLQATVAVIGPDPQNVRAVRSYEKAGFSWLKTVYVTDEERPSENGEEYLMARYSTGFEARK
ncbi:MAG: GNAT family N-acetyltransferase [Thermomicrobiales bacterium]